ncbi:MAG: hypothetical protein M3Y28_10595 [Armatimonadota bacterium]|nr:hypothetical protein [Armatimonadota bacterium]
MGDIYLIITVLLRGVILLFTCLAVGACLSRARVHLAWLIPTVVGQSLSLIGNLLNMASIASLRTSGYSSNPLRWLFVSQQILYTLSTLCLVWAAVATFLTMRGLATNARPNPAVTETPGQWPPSPTPPVG